jgi:RNA polymerase sigma factor (sigma-70 family)
VYRSYNRVIFAVARRLLGSHDLAEEATQATFVKAWRAAQTFDSRRELGPWLATIARHAAIDLRRREARRATEPLDEGSSAAATIGDETEHLDAVWAVRSAIDCLAPGDQAVVRLMHLEQLTQPEVAERLGIPLGTVKSRAHRAHRQLAASLAC